MDGRGSSVLVMPGTAQYPLGTCLKDSSYIYQVLVWAAPTLFFRGQKLIPSQSESADPTPCIRDPITLLFLVVRSPIDWMHSKCLALTIIQYTISTTQKARIGGSVCGTVSSQRRVKSQIPRCAPSIRLLETDISMCQNHHLNDMKFWGCICAALHIEKVWLAEKTERNKHNERKIKGK